MLALIERLQPRLVLDPFVRLHRIGENTPLLAYLRELQPSAAPSRWSPPGAARIVGVARVGLRAELRIMRA